MFDNMIFAFLMASSSPLYLVLSMPWVTDSISYSILWYRPKSLSLISFSIMKQIMRISGDM